MRQICCASGVPDTAILLEDRSRTTLENLENTGPILMQLGQPSIVIVTDHYHKWRALLVARHLGFQARVSCPAMTGTSRPKLVKSWLREIPALLYYWWRLKRPGKQPSG
jgi:uncharacterized SAM-binding protein YcdF (DUF218 family)